jgi:signal transduction histidine kinase
VVEFHGDCFLDVEKMIRVLYNLSGNAIDAMPGGGNLTISARSVNDELVLELVDSGIGMSHEIRENIFQPFFTFGKKHGTGLGLSIVKRIVEDHQGRIEIESEVNHGSTFRVILPQEKTQ